MQGRSGNKTKYLNQKTRSKDQPSYVVYKSLFIVSFRTPEGRDEI